MTLNDLTPEQQLANIYDQMKGFRITNAHRKKCTIKSIENVLEQLCQMFNNYPARFRELEWHQTVECVYWSKVKNLAISL